MTYEEIKEAARQVEQREDPSLSDDHFIWDNAVPILWDDGQWDHNGPPLMQPELPLSMQAMHAQPTTVGLWQELSLWRNLGLRITTMEWTAVSWRVGERIWDLIPVTMRA